MLGVLLMAAGFMVGCGGAEPLEETQAELDTRQDLRPFCGPSAYTVTYYSDATLTTPVGATVCECYATAWVIGRTTAFAVTEYEYSCE
ncbi:hypothetical protein MFU01_16620 [Myxococcus fulvus]|nr:hypothetical protein MFUL124B02_40095 [Myxococcus fulvus 124B02]GEN06625.1 hypothetical protein MFU01_16620 [Myxococcus fulvus]